MAIQTRNGLKEQLIPSKLLPGEFAVATDTGNAWYCYGGGKVMLMATATDIETLRQEAGNYQETQALIIDKIQQAVSKNTADIVADEKAKPGGYSQPTGRAYGGSAGNCPDER